MFGPRAATAAPREKLNRLTAVPGEMIMKALGKVR
jgi:hypothetical protein